MGDAKKIAMTVIAIEDSRCPINASCVTAGFAMIKIKFEDEAKEQTIALCKGGCSIAAIPTRDIIVLNGNRYELELEDITPYPTLDKVMPEPSKAYVKISIPNP